MKQRYWNLFVINAAILMIFVQLIDKLQRNQGFEYLGFCGRDTYYLYQLYKKFKLDRNEQLPSCDYLYYSRKLSDDCIEDMVKYFSSRIKNRKALLIDIYGTGVHLSKIKEMINANCSILINIWSGYESAIKIYNYPDFSKNWFRITEAIESTSNDEYNFYMIDMKNDNFGMHDGLEWFNRATHNSPIRLKAVEIADKIIPEVVFNEHSDTENLVVFETFMKEMLNSNVKWLRTNDIKLSMDVLKFLLVNFAVEGNRIILR